MASTKLDTGSSSTKPALNTDLSNPSMHSEPDNVEIENLTAPPPLADENLEFQNMIRDNNERFMRNIVFLSSDYRRSITASYCLRLMVLRFTEAVRDLGIEGSVRVTCNAQGEVHLTDCVWCNDAVSEGPDTCHCCRALENPRGYFRSKYGIVSDEEEESLRRQLEEIQNKKSSLSAIMDYSNITIDS